MEQPLDFHQPTPPTAWPPQPSAKSTGWRLSLCLVIVMWLSAGSFAAVLHQEAVKDLVARGLAPFVALGDTSISPGDSGNEPGSLICNDVRRAHAARLTGGASLMKRSNEGRNLYNDLLASDACITVRDLGDFAGFAIPRRSLDGSWTHSTIEIDRDYLESVGSDVLAATLVHEATHLDRAFRGTSCHTSDDCTELDNSVLLEEEVAAHSAEARWWIANYGRDGTSDPDPIEAWQNTLAFAYLAGAETFENFVESFRSDPAEASR